MTVITESARLLIRKIENEDAEEMFLMDSDPEVHGYLGNHPVTTVEQTREQIASIHTQYLDHGIGRWAITDKQSNTFMGWTGFKWIAENLNGYNNFYDFGYRLQRKHWGKGFATEAGRAALTYGASVLALQPVFAATDPDNTASRHVLEKLGFQYSGLFPYDGSSPWRAKGEPTAWFVFPDTH